MKAGLVAIGIAALSFALGYGIGTAQQSATDGAALQMIDSLRAASDSAPAPDQTTTYYPFTFQS